MHQKLCVHLLHTSINSAVQQPWSMVLYFLYIVYLLLPLLLLRFVPLSPPLLASIPTVAFPHRLFALSAATSVIPRPFIFWLDRCLLVESSSSSASFSLSSNQSLLPLERPNCCPLWSLAEDIHSAVIIIENDPIPKRYTFISYSDKTHSFIRYTLDCE